MAVTPTIQDEVAFIASVASNGTLAATSYYSWNRNTAATYSSQWTTARKWGATSAGSSGGTVTYYFNPTSNWSATEQKWLAAGLALWSAVANIKFVLTTNRSQAKIIFNRTNDGGSYTYAIYSPVANADVTGGTVLGTLTSSSINIDTTGTSFGPITGLASQGGFPIENLLHEEGHALGLGHAGPYDGGVNTYTQQYSAYDTKLYSVMSYINPGTASKYSSQYPVTGVNWGGGQPTTWMPLDILAIQRLYGVATTTPLSGGQVFGFHTNITGALQPFFDFTQNTKPIITIWDKGTGNTLDLSGFTGTASINLNPGTFSSAAGLTKNIAIAYGTKIDRLVCTAGGTSVTCNNDGDTVVSGAGSDTIRGGTGTDTVVFSGYQSAYQVVTGSGGIVTVTSAGVSDTLTSIEVLKFADKSLTLFQASGVSATLHDIPQIGWDPSSPLLAKASSSTMLMDVSSTDVLAGLQPSAPLANSTPMLNAGLLESRLEWLAATG